MLWPSSRRISRSCGGKQAIGGGEETFTRLDGRASGMECQHKLPPVDTVEDVFNSLETEITLLGEHLDPRFLSSLRYPPRNRGGEH
jgi:hypothetical protein